MHRSAGWFSSAALPCAVPALFWRGVSAVAFTDAVPSHLQMKCFPFGRSFFVSISCNGDEKKQHLPFALQAAGIACSYAHLNSISFAIKEVTKVCVAECLCYTYALWCASVCFHFGVC